MYRYTPNVYRYTLAKNDQKPKCTGTCSKCTGTLHRKVPKMCVFTHFSCTFIHGSLLYFLHTSKSFQIHLETSFLFKSSFNGYLSSKFFHESLPRIIPTWVTTHTQIKHDDYLGFNLNPSSITCYLTCITLKRRISYLS